MPSGQIPVSHIVLQIIKLYGFSQF